MPCKVSGVTTAPSDMPMSTNIARISSVGTDIDRPARAAPATARMEPDSQPAGTPARPSTAPPTAATPSVSARWRRSVSRFVAEGADKGSVLKEPGAPGVAAHQAGSMTRADARVKCLWGRKLQVVISEIDNARPIAAAEHNTHKISGISRANLFHDAAPMDFHSTRTDSETTTSFFVGSTFRNLRESFAFTRCQTALARKV